MTSVQPSWMLRLPLQQQSVLFLAGRGPDGIAKNHPCKVIVRAYRGTIFKAAYYGRELRFGEGADTFMDLSVIGNRLNWVPAVKDFFQTVDELPHHYLMHLMHGAQILGYKHPSPEMRERWFYFYHRVVEDQHLSPESEDAMDLRLGDWAQQHWDAAS